MLMAGIDGICTELHPKAHDFGPFDVDIAQQPRDFRDRIAALPRSLHDAGIALQEDHDYLTAGEVFNDAFVNAWAESKIEDEARVMKARPHPYEYALYLDT
jgi:glutamine synthetase